MIEKAFNIDAFFFSYNIDHQTPDSAATATAYLCGVKAQLGTIGVDGRAKRSDCLSSLGTNVSSILNWAQDLGTDFFKIDACFHFRVSIKVTKSV